MLPASHQPSPSLAEPGPARSVNSPEVDNQHLRTGQTEQRRFALKVLIFASLPPIRPLDIHDQRRAIGRRAHPDPPRRLLSLALVHHVEARAEQPIEERGLPGGLGAEDGDDIVSEAFIEDAPFCEVGGELFAGQVRCQLLILPSRGDVREYLVLVHDL